MNAACLLAAVAVCLQGAPAEQDDGESVDALIEAATTPPQTATVYPVRPSLSTAVRDMVGWNLRRDPVREAFGRLDARRRREAEWFDAVTTLEKEKAVWCLQACLVHPSKNVQLRALRTLGRLKDEDAVPFLLIYGDYLAVRTERERFQDDEDVRTHALLQHAVAHTLFQITGVEVVLNGTYNDEDGQRVAYPIRDPKSLNRGLQRWRRWLLDRQRAQYEASVGLTDPPAGGGRSNDAASLLDGPPGPVDVTADDLSFAVATDQAVYRPIEPIFITSTLANRSERTLIVREPVGYVVSFTLERLAEEDDGKGEVVGGSGAGGAYAAWIGKTPALPPGGSCSHTTDASAVTTWERFNSLGPGKYQLHATYHLAKPGVGLYEATFGESDEIPEEYRRFVLRATTEIRIRPLEKNELAEWKAYEAVRRPVWRTKRGPLPDAAAEIQAQAAAERLDEFFENRPSSIYRVQASDLLIRFWWSRKNYRKVADVYAKARDEKRGADRRDAIIYAEVELREKELNDAAGALRVLEESYDPLPAGVRASFLTRHPELAPAAPADAPSSETDP